MELRVVEERFMPMMADEEGNRWVSAYDLYIETGETDDITRWLNNILESKWIMEEDFLILKNSLNLTSLKKLESYEKISVDLEENKKSQVKPQNVIFSPEAAKHICLMADTEIGYQIRKYLIQMEKDYKLIQKYGESTVWKEKYKTLETKAGLMVMPTYVIKTINNLVENGILSQEQKAAIISKQVDIILNEHDRLIEKIPEFIERLRYDARLLPEYQDILQKLNGRTNSLVRKRNYIKNNKNV